MAERSSSVASPLACVGTRVHALPCRPVVEETAAATAVLEVEGGTVVSTRASRNATVSLEERVQVANEAEVDAVVSIHCNSAEVCPTRDEARVYYYRASERWRELVLRVIASFQERGLPVASDPRGREFYVLRYTWAPAVLVELGFICFALGAERLMSGRGQVDGVVAVVESMSREVSAAADEGIPA